MKMSERVLELVGGKRREKEKKQKLCHWGKYSCPCFSADYDETLISPW